MSEIKYKVGRDINDIILGFTKGNYESVREASEAILSIPELAVVDREAKLPDIPETIPVSDSIPNWICINTWDKRMIFDFGQQSMRVAGWVKEVKK